ncbi:hypothetical protein NF27_II00010, partial [Candidatus Jidaibacter acanthamoeba]
MRMNEDTCTYTYPEQIKQEQQGYESLQAALNYKFKNIGLLIQALTRRAAVNLKDNETLEFIGDRALELAVTDIIMEKHQGYTEGTLNNILSSLVRNDGPLLDVAKRLEISEHMIPQGKVSDRRLADAMEAIIGAIFLDSGKDYAVIKGFIIRHWVSLNLDPEEVAFQAIGNKDIQLLKGLLKTGVNPNALISNKIGEEKWHLESYSLLYSAVAVGKKKIIKALLKAGADPNQEVIYKDNKAGVYTSFPLLSAINVYLKKRREGEGEEELINNHYDKIISLLINYNADINKVNNYGNSALHEAVTIEVRVVERLIHYRAKVNISNNIKQTPLHILAGRGDSDKKTAKTLIRAGANIDAVDKEGYTPLHFAIMKENIDIIKLLIKKGANVNRIDNTGRTALHILVYCNTS